MSFYFHEKVFNNRDDLSQFILGQLLKSVPRNEGSLYSVSRDCSGTSFSNLDSSIYLQFFAVQSAPS